LALLAVTARAFEDNDMLKRPIALTIFAAVAACSTVALAQTPPAAPDCAARATEKKLHGAALNSFMKKCDRDAAAATCEAAAAEKKLAGAAKASFTKKCIRDATATPGAQ
jgi:membrane-bound lytic murein transglycosylase B